jgi:hypothetical protein
MPLLSSDLKRIKSCRAVVCGIMIFARYLDLSWLIEPNVPDAPRNLHFSVGILEYAVLPVAWWPSGWRISSRSSSSGPLIATNDPHLVKILEPERAHA